MCTTVPGGRCSGIEGHLRRNGCETWSAFLKSYGRYGSSGGSNVANRIGNRTQKAQKRTQKAQIKHGHGSSCASCVLFCAFCVLFPILLGKAGTGEVF